MEPGQISLVELLLREQHALTPVEQFAAAHASGTLPASGRHFETRIPTNQPGPGEQYAFGVDLDLCTGCTSCVSACHSLNGLDDDESWRTVGVLHGGTPAAPVVQTVTSACHHCLEPACSDGCPVNAYTKDPITGIVRHLDDQCIGCQYCLLTCPYEVPKLVPHKGIVRKCDLCSNRLAVGEAPACVQSCPNGALTVKIVRADDIRASTRQGALVPGTVPSSYTSPTTVYSRRTPLPANTAAADAHALVPQTSHLPLLLLLVLTQAAVGAFTSSAFVRQVSDPAIIAFVGPYHVLMATALALAGLAASVLHMGRPRYAFRAVLNVRRSWLSREVALFGVFSNIIVVYAVAYWAGPIAQWLDVPILAELATDRVVMILGLAAAATGIAGVISSIRVYQVTHRHAWRGHRTAVRFVFTGIILGTASVLATSILVTATAPHSFDEGAVGLTLLSCWALAVPSAIKLIYEAALFSHRNDPLPSPLGGSARLQLGVLRRATIARFALGIVGGIVLPLVLGFSAAGGPATLPFLAVLSVLSLAACMGGELFERYLYFRSVDAPKMPGGFRP